MRKKRKGKKNDVYRSRYERIKQKREDKETPKKERVT